MMTKFHHHFLLNFSSWPLIASFNAFNFMFSLLMFLKFNCSNLFLFNLIFMSLISFYWWISYSDEFNLEGKSSLNLENGLKFSMLLFISSEIFFFFSFFWSYFHFYLSPCMEVGLLWPSLLIETFNCINVPLINTLLLVSSGVTVTISHYYLIIGKKKLSSIYLTLTIFLGILFTICQIMEYFSSFFTMSDGNFGTSFFMLTGFHGIHVLIGTIFLVLVLIRFMKIISSKKDCLSFELSSWYWHFVDVVWIFLYTILYYMNN